MKMTNDKTELNDFELDEVFAAARREAPAVSEDFMARIVADAFKVQDEFSAPAVETEDERLSLFEMLWDMLGGWAGAGGLVAAAATGLWIGIAPPNALSLIDEAIWGSSVDLTVFSGDDILGLEG